MCTAINLHGYRHLFGRTLDLERSYGECAVITPRNLPIEFIYEGKCERHTAIMGVATVANGTPLYYDAINEWGVGIAALNFPKYAVYLPPRANFRNVASYELIPFVLSRCKSVSEARALLEKTNVTPDSFCDSLPPTPLHWIIADKSCAIVAEPGESGLEIYENKAEVLTNSPDFNYHVTRLSEYMHLSPETPENTLSLTLETSAYSRGLGSVGLPGDWSSASRFVRAVYVKLHTFADGYDGELSRFFHILDTVSVPCGVVACENGECVKTRYTSCADLEKCKYYFTTYKNRSIREVDLGAVNLEGSAPFVFRM